MFTNDFSRSIYACGLFAAALFIAGCEDFNKATQDAEHTTDARPAPKLDDAPQAQPPAQANQPTAAAPGPTAAPAAAPNPNARPALSDAPPMEKAQAGVGVQGQGYGGGIMTEPVSQYFQQRDRIALEIQVPHQLQLWKAEHNNKNPKNKDEFVKEILEPCGVKLPDLPQGKQYYYDAKTGELMVGPEKK